jgi:hypothetical protein
MAKLTRKRTLDVRADTIDGSYGMVGDGMEQRPLSVKQGDLSLGESVAGVRALIVAMKRGNSRGAKGCRKVDGSIDHFC